MTPQRPDRGGCRGGGQGGGGSVSRRMPDPSLPDDAPGSGPPDADRGITLADEGGRAPIWAGRLILATTRGRPNSPASPRGTGAARRTADIADNKYSSADSLLAAGAITTDRSRLEICVPGHTKAHREAPWKEVQKAADIGLGQCQRARKL